MLENLEEKLMELSRILKGRKNGIIVSHTNPDPDAIAAAILLKRLLWKKFGFRTKLAYDGVVGRAENKELLSYTKAKFSKITTLSLKKFDLVAMVDTQPGTGNNSWKVNDEVHLVFDHHRIRPKTKHAPFYVVHSHIGTTSTLIYQFLKAAGVEIESRLATAVVYALWSETAGLMREATTLDTETYNELYQKANKRALSTINLAKVDLNYFSSIHCSIEQAELYGRTIVVPMRELPYPDVTAEVAEHFLRYRKANYVLAMGQYKDEILFSIRCDKPNAQLDILARKVVGDMGTAGGHGSSAGGQITLESEDEKHARRVRKLLTVKFLKFLKISQQKPVKLTDIMKKC